MYERDNVDIIVTLLFVFAICLSFVTAVLQILEQTDMCVVPWRYMWLLLISVGIVVVAVMLKLQKKHINLQLGATRLSFELDRSTALCISHVGNDKNAYRLSVDRNSWTFAKELGMFEVVSYGNLFFTANIDHTVIWNNKPLPRPVEVPVPSGTTFRIIAPENTYSKVTIECLCN